MSDFTNSGERVKGGSGLSIFFRSPRPKGRFGQWSSSFRVLTPIVATTRGLIEAGRDSQACVEKRLSS